MTRHALRHLVIHDKTCAGVAIGFLRTPERHEERANDNLGPDGSRGGLAAPA